VREIQRERTKDSLHYSGSCSAYSLTIHLGTPASTYSYNSLTLSHGLSGDVDRADLINGGSDDIQST
jgi:hypothetical protein